MRMIWDNSQFSFTGYLILIDGTPLTIEFLTGFSHLYMNITSRDILFIYG